MTVEPLLPRTVDGYLDDLVTAQLYDPVLADLERRAQALELPTRGRAVGRHLEIVLRLAGASRVVEFGAGFGETTYWLARAVGDDGEVIAVIADPDDAAVAESMLRRAGLFERVTIVSGGPSAALAALDGDVDAVVGPVDAGVRGAPDGGVGNRETADRETADREAADRGVADRETADRKAADRETADRKAADREAADRGADRGADPAAQLWIEAADRVSVGGVLALLDVLRAGDVARGAGAPSSSELDRVVAICREVVNDPRYDSTITPLRDGIQLAHRHR